MGSIKVGYVLKSFPVLSQTFVNNEMLTLHKLGVPFEIFSFFEPPASDVHHETILPLLDRVIYWRRQRESKANVAWANLALLIRGGLCAYREAFQMAESAEFMKGMRAFSRLAYWAHVLRRRGVTHLHAHFASEGAIAARIFSRLTRLPYSVTVHANDLFVHPKALDPLLAEAAFVVTVSQYNKDYILQQSPTVPASRVHVLHPWVDLEHFAPVSPQSDGQLRIFSVGRLVEKKGHIYLVEACHLLQKRGVDFICRIVGEGPLRGELENLILERGLQERVQLLGPQPHQAVRQLLGKSTVFVLPCVIAADGDRDGMPVALTEAMACGLPVVSTTIVGIPELVQEGTGLLVPPRDAPALAKALHQVAEMEVEERDAMGRRGRAVVAAEFDLNRGTEQLVKLFAQATATIGENRSGIGT